jgi:hypothetical protein
MDITAPEYLKEIKEAFIAGFESGLNNPYHFADEKEKLLESEFELFVERKIEERKSK